MGSPYTRHDDYRAIIFDVLPCQPNISTGTCLNTTASTSQLAASQMEAVLLFDTQYFNPFLNTNHSIAEESIIRSFAMNNFNK